MRFNKTEVAALALGQPSHKFEKEGVLFVKEKQEGFFRRSEKSPAASPKKKAASKLILGCYGGVGIVGKEVSVERWCRLRGNLLFYFKSRDQWSEPAGVIVVENCRVRCEINSLESTFGLVLEFGGGQQQHLATYTEAEREAWVSALRTASHKQMRSHLAALKSKLEAKMASIAGLEAEATTVDLSNNSNTTTNVSTANGSSSNTTEKQPCSSKRIPVIDPSETPLCEMSISCDNLLCDALGRSPSARIVIYVNSSTTAASTASTTSTCSRTRWTLYGQTEVAEKSSNPVFLRTITFRESDGLSGDLTSLRIEAHDMRERFTATRALLGIAFTNLNDLKQSVRTRLKLESPNPDGRSAGFVTLNCWGFDSAVAASTDSTPIHRCNNNMASQIEAGGGRESRERIVSKEQPKHRRSHSLPPAMRHRAKLPNHGALGLLFTNPMVRTYKFHSGLAGDISVQEMLAESKLSFAFPQQLLSLWICEEKELVHEIAGLGELKSPWHDCQMAWLENHLNIINAYSKALENLDSYKGPNFRKSTAKESRTYEFVPTNLHLQRMWVENDSLRKVGTYDIFTHGAFTSMANRKEPGLIKMLKELKAPQRDSHAWCSQSDQLQMAEDTLSAVRRVRREVVDCMRHLMKAAKEKKSDGMFSLIEDMLRKTKCLCSLLDQNVVEAVFCFLEDNKVSVRPEKDEFSESVAEFMQRNKLKIDLPFLCRPNRLLGPSLQTPCTEFVAKELRTPEVDSLFSPVVISSNGSSSAENSGDFWRTYSAYTSGYQSVDKLSDIDEFEESFRYLSVVDKTKHYYTLCSAAAPVDTPPCVGTPKHAPKSHQVINNDHDEFDTKTEMEYEDEFGHVNNNDEGIPIEECLEPILEDDHEEMVENDLINDNDNEETSKEVTVKDEEEEKDQEGKDDKDGAVEKEATKDQGTATDLAEGLHYKAGDEPEPIDLTHLNVEAAMMCLASKVRILCGKANSPTLSSRTFRFKELDAMRKHNQPTSNALNNACFEIPDVPKPNQSDAEDIEDWTAELRPSMRKLRQGMDSLCKTAKLTCSVLRLKQTSEAVNLSHAIKYRRDICFSQALTTLVTSLMTKLWCTPQDQAASNAVFLTICTQLGPLVCFESLLSLHGEDVSQFNDMIVVIEDLRNVDFTLILVDKRSRLRTASRNSSGSDKNDKGSKDNAAKNSPSIPILEYLSFPLPRITGSRSALKVLLPVPDYVYTMLPLEDMKSMTFSVTPVFFNVGINEKATIAEKFGNNGPQEKNNIDNYKTMAEYYRRYKKLNLDFQPKTSKRGSAFSTEPDLEDLLAIMKNEVNNRKSKNVEILHLASNISRRLNGLRFTNCKSGKDRTGMSATLEQVQILSRDYDLAEHEYSRALDVMRSEGTRMDNAEKNIGTRKFAFNSLQLSTFPYQYRPPVGTYGGKVQT